MSFNSFAAFAAFLALSAFFLFALVLLFNPLTALSLPALTSPCACPCCLTFVAIPDAVCIISLPFCIKLCPAVLVELNNLAIAFIIVPTVLIIEPPIYINVACTTLPKLLITFDIPPNVADITLIATIIIPTVPKKPLDITNCNALLAPVSAITCAFTFVITPPNTVNPIMLKGIVDTTARDVTINVAVSLSNPFTICVILSSICDIVLPIVAKGNNPSPKNDIKLSFASSILALVLFKDACIFCSKLVPKFLEACSSIPIIIICCCSLYSSFSQLLPLAICLNASVVCNTLAFTSIPNLSILSVSPRSPLLIASAVVCIS